MPKKGNEVKKSVAPKKKIVKEEKEVTKKVDTLKNDNKTTKKFLILLVVVIVVVCLSLFFAYLISPYTIVLNGDKEITLTCGSQYEEYGAVVKRFIFVTDKSVEVDSNVDTSRGGDYKVIYKYDSMSITRLVHVKDGDGPKIIISAEDPTLILNVNGKKDVFDHIGFIDSNDGVIENDAVEVTDNININELGEYEVKYKVCDKSNNCSELTRKVIVKDLEAPVITINRPDLKIPLGNKYNEYGASAIDNYDKNLGEVKITSNVDMNKEGTYEVKYSICDSSNNCSEKVRKVTVYKEEEKQETAIFGGNFKSHPSIEGTLPSRLKLNGSNKTAVFTINYCEGMDDRKGTYTVSGNTITVTLKVAWGGKKVFKFTKVNNNTLRLDTNITACAPYQYERFTRV